MRSEGGAVFDPSPITRSGTISMSFDRPFQTAHFDLRDSRDHLRHAHGHEQFVRTGHGLVVDVRTSNVGPCGRAEQQAQKQIAAQTRASPSA